jgi:dGTPase
MKTPESSHREEVLRAVQRAISRGITNYTEILTILGGADPVLVKELLEEVLSKRAKSIENISVSVINKHTQTLHARRLSAHLPLSLPAPNPMLSQWWFTLDTVCKLAVRVWELAEDNRVAFLGTPTVGFHYSNCYDDPCSILDVDKHLIESLTLPNSASKFVYDVNDELPESLHNSHKIVLIDPPWYQQSLYQFIAQSRELISDHGFILCVLPSRLTRPGIIKERSELIKNMLKGDFEVVSLESDYVQYRVPEFEAKAYDNISEFSGRWWRKGDLLVLRVQPESKIVSRSQKKEIIDVFARNITYKRFFLSPSRANSALLNQIEVDSAFENTVSTRTSSTNEIAVWGSNKRGARIKDPDVIRQILNLWQEGNSNELVIEKLKGSLGQQAVELVSSLDSALKIWQDEQETFQRRQPYVLDKLRSQYLSKLAAQATGRIYEFQGDGFRIDFQRDRDRILWSHSLTRLAGKTQLFPVKSDDHLRRRLAHSIEVMQLASTISIAFGLDRDLTEAGALAHDIGHTPFGHAGEYALNKALDELDTRLGGFNHYEHGVDVVRWLEDAYQSAGAGGFPGLNLTFETTECIFKHTFYRGEEISIGQRSLSNSTKYRDFMNDVSCHLEGQAVRIADKISYLISDLEDGIRLGIISLDNLLNCKFFERAPIDIIPSPSESLYDRFISQRRAILKVIMEDVLSATDRRLARISSLNDIRTQFEYLVNHSIELQEDMDEIWNKLQVGILHNDSAVKAENARAARIVRDLFILYSVTPHLIETRFKDAYDSLLNSQYIKWYLDKVGPEVGIPKKNLSRFAYEHIIGTTPRSQGDNWMISTLNIILAKDYVASLTDTRAFQEHNKHFGGSVDYSSL